jgi:hypothetical protein
MLSLYLDANELPNRKHLCIQVYMKVIYLSEWAIHSGITNYSSGSDTVSVMHDRGCYTTISPSSDASDTSLLCSTFTGTEFNMYSWLVLILYDSEKCDDRHEEIGVHSLGYVITSGITWPDCVFILLDASTLSHARESFSSQSFPVRLLSLECDTSSQNVFSCQNSWVEPFKISWRQVELIH